MTTTEVELDRFAAFAREKLSNDGIEKSLDELFDLWRAENPSQDLYRENVLAARAAIEDFKNGDRGLPAGDHSTHLRREFGINLK